MSGDEVHAEISRLAEEQPFTGEEIGATCCFATPDKVWVAAPDAGDVRCPAAPTCC